MHTVYEVVTSSGAACTTTSLNRQRTPKADENDVKPWPLIVTRVPPSVGPPLGIVESSPTWCVKVAALGACAHRLACINRMTGACPPHYT